jgi:hypothetical protein
MEQMNMADSKSGRATSPLLRLPGEIRNQIYTYLFASTRLTFSFQSLGEPSEYWTRPAAHSLALLRVCRRIHVETKNLWLPHVLFNFQGIEDLLDKLCPLPLETLQKIKHVRVGAKAVMMTPPGDYQDIYVRMPWLLKLLPDLRLDTLTVLGDTAPNSLYLVVDLLVQHGHGWKELRVIAPSSGVFAWKAVTTIFGPPTLVRAPQPAGWSEVLMSRDGRDPGACVQIYRAKTLETGVLFEPSKREVYTQRAPSPAEAEAFAFTTPPDLSPKDEMAKELLVIVRRGRGVDLGDVGPVLPMETGDMRAWSEGRQWKRLKQDCIDMSFGSDSEDEGEGEELGRMGEGSGAGEDVYGDVQEYEFRSIRRNWIHYVEVEHNNIAKQAHEPS